MSSKIIVRGRVAKIEPLERKKDKEKEIIQKWERMKGGRNEQREI